MFTLRRTALRALLAKPCTSSIILPKTRTFITVQQSKLRPVAQSNAFHLQKRFASDGTTEGTREGTAQEVVEDTAQSTARETVGSTTEEIVDVNESAVEEAAVASSQAAETSTTEADSEQQVPVEVNGKEQSPFAEAAASVTATASAAAAAVGVQQFSSQSAPNSTQDMAPEKTVYVGNLFFEVTDADLHDYFSRFGPIKSTVVIKDDRGLSRGFGYVEFVNVDSTSKAIDEANARLLQGRRMNVGMLRQREPRLSQMGMPRDTSSYEIPSRTLFIGNLSFEMSDKDLGDLFREVRNVIDVRIAIDRRTGQPRGFAHADFLDIESAQKARDFLHNKVIYGRSLKINFATTKGRTS